MTDFDQLDPIPADEQARADRLAAALDRLLSGQPPGLDDPVMDTVAQLAGIAIVPSAASQARFEKQLYQWFRSSSPPAARPTRLIAPVITAIIFLSLGIIIGIVIGMAMHNTGSSTPTAISTPTTLPTPSITITPTASATPTASLSATVTNTEPSTMTATNSPTTPGTTPSPSVTMIIPTVAASATPISFVYVVIVGRIQNISGSQIVVFDQPIQIEGGTSGLCLNDLVSVEAFVASDRTLHAVRSAVTVQISGCAIVTVAPTAMPNPGKSGGGDDHHQAD